MFLMMEDTMSYKSFDLNIEKILEDWEPHHAVRELISNAIDEQELTNTKDISITKSSEDTWIIRDFGRGLKHTHLTQNENPEKIENENIIGKFGIGLKDALATFERHGIGVQIISKHGRIEIAKATKHGFDDIITLHAKVYEEEDRSFVGTKIILSGISDYYIHQAKQLFLRFNEVRRLDSTEFGDIYSRNHDTAVIYVNGVQVAEEENFLFSYNITSLNAKIKKSLNRERTNVGRTAYSDRVKSILLSSRSENVMDKLSMDLSNIDKGKQHDELLWLDVQVHAIKILNESKNRVFVTPGEAIQDNDLIDDMQESGENILFIPQKTAEKIRGTNDNEGNPIREIWEYRKEYTESFEYDFVPIQKLSKREQDIYNYKDRIIALFGGVPQNVSEIKISENIRPKLYEDSAAGVYESLNQRIIIKRSQLSKIENFAGTLMHELVHAKTGYSDVTRDFESALTSLTGKLTYHILSNDYSSLNDDNNQGYNDGKDYSFSSIETLEKAAQNQDASAQFRLGSIYFHGDGVKCDYNKSLHWFKQAAQNGDISAQNNVAAHYIEGWGTDIDYEQAIYWLKKCIKIPRAQSNMGYLYEKGYGVKRDYKKAYYYYHKAARKGYVEAYCHLAELYFEGKGVLKDSQEALKKLEYAASNHSAEAQYRLGEIYLYGKDDIIRDVGKAKKWLKKSFSNGVDEAGELLNQLINKSD